MIMISSLYRIRTHTQIVLLGLIDRNICRSHLMLTINDQGLRTCFRQFQDSERGKSMWSTKFHWKIHFTQFHPVSISPYIATYVSQSPSVHRQDFKPLRANLELGSADLVRDISVTQRSKKDARGVMVNTLDDRYARHLIMDNTGHL